MPDTIIYGTSGNDNLSGGNGTDTIHGLDGDDIISGGNGIDTLFGDGGNDQLTGDNGADNLTGGADDDVLDGLSGFDTAYYSGQIEEYNFLFAAGYLHIIHNGGAGADGHDQVRNVERLVFADRVIEIGSGSNVPVASDDHVFIDEDAGTHNSGSASVRDNDFDFDGDPLTVTAGTFTGTYGTLTLNSDGTYSYTLFASAQELAQGEDVQDSFNYIVSDDDGSDTGTLTFHIAGINDAPTANPDADTTDENAAILVAVLANDTDIDNGAVLTVTAASAPAGQGTASVVGNQVQFDPGSDFDDLAVGDSEVVVVSYDITDEHGATDSSTLTITVTGTNDGPVANPDSDTTDENTAILIDVLANDTDADNGTTLTVTAASAPAGQGTASLVGNQVEFDPGSDFDDLAVGDSEVVVVSYDIEDDQGATASSTITITVTGTNDGPVANPDTDTTSENGVLQVDVLANDTDADNGAVLTVTAASAPVGQGTATVVGNQVEFDPGTDFDYLAFGQNAQVVISYDIADEHGATSSSTVTITVEGDDEGPSGTPTEGNDTLIGTSGADTIDALGGNDTVSGRAGDDVLLGGNGADFVDGQDGDDVVEGGNDDDILLGGNGNDELSGQAGNDFLFGENGDDVLDGGDDSDYLADFDGDNSLVGGLGDDEIVAGSSTGAQTIDGGDGNDTIRHYYRHSASTITTGAGSDTIEFSYADQGTAAITVTDFTPGAGGDVFRLSGDDGSLLSLLSGWDGTSNPFGSGFLRLTQSGADTLLEWDQDGGAGGSDWETLVVLENTAVGDFTEANFVPGYDPDGSAPPGETITGTNDGETLTGTIGNDTINALGGDDTVSGLAGADLIDGGDGFDILDGGSDDDTLYGGNDDDTQSGGDGDDAVSGQAGNDSLFGDDGDDQLSGGDGDDSLDGGDGDDALDGGDGDDSLSDLSGVNSLVGGLGGDHIIAGSSEGAQTIDGGDGNDTIRHYYRYAASTITTGTGSDTIELFHANLGSAAIVVTDFTPGAAGDVVRLSGDERSVLGLLSGWDGSSNPFGSGFLRVQQSGADTVLQWDQDGAAGGENWETLIVFENTDAEDFTEANFEPGYDPDGGEPGGQTITGTDDGETLTGLSGDDTINALGGDDTVFGLAGADTIDGGDGFDQLYGGEDNDAIEGGNDDDILFGGDGDDQLSGGAGNDSIAGEAGNDELSGGDGNDGLDGGDGDDALGGGAGDDFLTGGLGSDVLTGGLDADIFDFQSAEQGPDEITDFVSGTDKIFVSASGFGGNLEPGGEVSLVSGSNPVVAGSGGQFLYDTDDGSLLWDADGTGSGAAVLVATFSNLPSLVASDFLVL